MFSLLILLLIVFIIYIKKNRYISVAFLYLSITYIFLIIGALFENITAITVMLLLLAFATPCSAATFSYIITNNRKFSAGLFGMFFVLWLYFLYTLIKTPPQITLTDSMLHIVVTSYTMFIITYGFFLPALTINFIVLLTAFETRDISTKLIIIFHSISISAYGVATYYLMIDSITAHAFFILTALLLIEMVVLGVMKRSR